MPNATDGTMAAESTSVRRTEILSRRVACTNRVWNVYFTHVKDAATEVPDYLVIEPKTRTPDNVTGVAVIPVLRRQIGLLAIDRVALDSVVIESPKIASGFASNPTSSTAVTAQHSAGPAS